LWKVVVISNGCVIEQSDNDGDEEPNNGGDDDFLDQEFSSGIFP